MTWRLRSLAVLSAVLCVLASGLISPASAGISKGTLLASLDADRSQIQSWQVQVSGLGGIGAAARTSMSQDLSSLAGVVSALRTKSAGDSGAALNADYSSYLSLHTHGYSFESQKFHLALYASRELVAANADVGKVLASGGLDPHSTIHHQAAGLMALLQVANADLSQAASLLAGAGYGGYPANRGIVTTAHSLIDLAAQNLVLVEKQLGQLRPGRGTQWRFDLKLYALNESEGLSRLQTTVLNDADLTSGERQNIMTQINADLLAFNQLYTFLLKGGGGSAFVGELATILNQPGVFVLIFPKADIMMAGAADRSAIAALTSLIGTLQARISAAGANGANTSHVSTLLGDLLAQLGAASSDIAPIDSEFESMVAITSAQDSHDEQLIQATLVALGDAAAHLSAARTDASQILSATA